MSPVKTPLKVSVVNSDDLLGNTIKHTSDYNIGSIASLPSQAKYDGDLLDFPIWDKELSSVEVTEWHNVGKVGDPRTQAPAANLVFWNRGGDGAVFNGSEWDFPIVIAGQTVGVSVNMEVNDRTTNIP